MTSEELDLSSPEQHKALAHPMRQRLLFALGGETGTISGLAAVFGVQKGTVAHHLKVLREAGLVEVVETRRVRGGTEQYYGRTARRMALADDAGVAADLFAAVGAEYAAAPREPLAPLLTIRHLRLTQAQAERLAAALQEVVDGAEEAVEGDAVHAVLVALYQRRG
ncbi:ArsR/SmtB family transcription factor [Kitasatospora azatica]|uniref:ArsR/SmtB family transcription factor n=1 Tax=Kitasatospora azatica TaxID=58347 RepID=UPI0005641CC3|nr:helix-turn-helix domain-containing protein [Kitasatospora azatica]